MTLVPASYVDSLSPRCPIALGTSPAAEAARWGANAREALLAAHRARVERFGRAPRFLPPPAVEAACAPPPFHAPPVAWPDPEIAPDPELAPFTFKTVSILRIQAACARAFGVTVRDILSSRRDKGVILPRHVAIFLARQLTLRSLPEIGRRFANQDHTTVLNAVRKVERLVKEDLEFAARVDGIREAIEAAHA